MSVFDGDNVITVEALTQFLIQLVVIVCFCRLLAYLFKYIKQPPVIAEVVAGILLGYSAFSSNEHIADTLFPKTGPSVTTVLNVFANVGLIAFMFLVGLELDPRLLKRNVRNSIIISVVAMIAPFSLGIGAAVLIYDKLIPHTIDFSSFLLFVAVALSITAFPVLARILAETHMLDDRVGNIALSSAAVDDVVAWCLLALVVAIARATDRIHALYTFLTLLGFIAFMLFGLRKVLIKVAERSRRHRTTSVHVIAFMLVLTFLCAWFTEIIGVHAIFGAFILGVVTPREYRFAINITERIEDFVVIVLLPLYFTYSGLRTDLQSLNSGTAWGLTVLVIVCATVGKIGGATLAARFTGNPWRDSFTVGVLMNTKGLVELIVLNLGLDVKVLTQEVFTMFVVMALVTTCVTTPLVHFIYLRYRDDNKNPKENYNLVMFIPDQKVAMDLVTFGKAISPADNPTAMKAIFLNEISDRPSSYFFQLSNKLKNDVPFFKDKASKDVFGVVKKFAKRQGVSINIKNLNSFDMTEAVKRTARGYACDLILFGVNTAVESGENALAVTSSTMNLTDVALDHVVGPHSPVGQIVQNAVATVQAPIGVYISKTPGSNEVARVSFLFHALEFENLAWQQVLKMPISIRVSVFTTGDAARVISLDYSKENHPNIEIIPHENPVDAIIGAQEGNPADLIILGSARGAENENIIKIVRSVAANVLVVYPLQGGAGKAPFDSESHKKGEH